METASKKTLLLVEDEPFLAISEKLILERRGFSVVLAADGASAVAAAADPGIELVLMDINLGEGMDGTEAAKAILAQRELPLIFLSSHTEREVVEKTEGITSYGYIVKNSGETVLLASINMAFKLHEARLGTERQKEQLRITLNSIGDAVIAADTAGRVVSMNPVAEQLTGWNATEAAGRPLSEVFRIVSALTRLPHPSPIDLVLATGAKIGLANHTVLIARDGTEYQIADSGAPIKDRQDRITGVVLVFRDVTADYELQDRLARSEEHLAKAQEIAGLGYVAQDLETGLCEWSAVARRIVGLAPDERPGIEALRARVHPDDLTSFDSPPSASPLTATEREYRLLRPDGSERRVRELCHADADRFGAPRLRYTILHDITEQAVLKTSLRDSEARYRALVEGTREKIFCLDPQGVYRMVNKAYAKALDLEPEDVVGKTTADLFPPEAAAVRIAFFNKALETRQPQYSEHRFTDIHGKLIYGQSTLEPIFDEAGKLVWIFGIARNVTEQKAAEIELRRLNEEKDLLLKDIHHRVKNNLSTIHSLLVLQAVMQESEAGKEAIEDAASRVRAMQNLYDKIYRAEAQESVDLASVLLPLAREMIAIFPQAAGLALKLDAENVVVRPALLNPLAIALNELVSNTMKHAFPDGRKGTITLRIHAAGGLLVLDYADDGVGVPADMDPENSAGFGLRLLVLLARQMKGDLKLDRSRGARFIMEVPLA